MGLFKKRIVPELSVAEALQRANISVHMSSIDSAVLTDVRAMGVSPSEQAGLHSQIKGILQVRVLDALIDRLNPKEQEKFAFELVQNNPDRLRLHLTQIAPDFGVVLLQQYVQLKSELSAKGIL